MLKPFPPLFYFVTAQSAQVASGEGDSLEEARAWLLEQGLNEDTAEKVSRLGGLDAIGAASEALLDQHLSSRSAHTPGDIKVRAYNRALEVITGEMSQDICVYR